MGPTFDRLGMRASHARAQSRTADHGGQLITARSALLRAEGHPSLRRSDDAAKHDASGGTREAREAAQY